jgi:hypothetical protein
MTREELEEVLYSATTISPLNKRQWPSAVNINNRTLGELRTATLSPDRRKSITALRRQLRTILNELPEDLTVLELRDLLEKK